MTLKLATLFVLGAALSFVVYVKIMDWANELARDWNTRNWFVE